MTVNVQVPVQNYTAAAAATVFSYPFKIFQSSDLLVQVDGVTKTLSTHYTVSGAGVVTGGNVTFLTPMTGGEAVSISRTLPAERDTDYQEGGDLLGSTHNEDHDYPIMLAQQLLARALLVAAGEAVPGAIPSKASRASKYLGFDSNGDPIAVSDSAFEALNITDFVKTLLDDASANAFVDTLVAGSTATALLAKLTTGAASLPGVVSPAALTGLTDDWVISGLATATVVRASSTGSFAITGISGGTAGKVIFLLNINAGNHLYLYNEEGTSAAANRIICTDISPVPAGHGVILWYDGTSSRWRLVSPVRPASESSYGVALLADQATTNTGTDDLTIVTPLKAKTAYGMTLCAKIDTAGLTQADQTGIPSGVKEIHVDLLGAGTAGPTLGGVILQIGDSGGIENASYAASGARTDGFYLGAGGGALYGRATLRLIDEATNQWAAAGVMGAATVNGIKSLSGVLDRVRIYGDGDIFSGYVAVSYRR